MDIDSTTQEKIKEVIVAEQGEGNDYTPPGIIAALLFQ